MKILIVEDEYSLADAISETLQREKFFVKICSNGEKVFVEAEKEDFEHILSTLLDNAIKHTESGNNVEVVLKKEKGNIILKVENEGSKIPEEEREKIFERFYRVDKSRNRSEKRYGLGLAIAKSTVEKYKGRINVGYKNGYTIFEIIIPT